MAEWFVEQGIAEERAIILRDSEIVAARVRWPGTLAAGQIEDAVLVSRAKGAARGTARFASGEEALIDRLPASVSEGSAIRLEVIRPALAERGRLKRAQARPASGAPRPAPTLAEALLAQGHDVRVVPRFPPCDWDGLMADAFAREIAFPGGSLLFSPTPAMLLIDIDGTLPPRALALAAVPVLAAALHRFDIGGSLGIDFPTLQAKADRKTVDEALDAALAEWPHERTAMNGFGFVQLVARLERPSLLQLATWRRTGAAGRMLLRRAEMLDGAGQIELAINPALRAEVDSQACTELVRRAGRPVRLRDDAALAIEAPHAQLVPL